MRKLLVLTLVAAASLGLAPSATASGTVTMTELSMLPGSYGGSVAGINDAGVAVGNSYLGLSTARAVRWEADGAVVPLAAYPGETDSYASTINADGVIVGWSIGERYRAVRWDTDGTVTDLGTLPGVRYASANAEAVNDSGVVAGYAYDAAYQQRAVRWDSDGTITDLGTLPGDTTSYAYAINADGVIVGSSTGAGGTRPVRWAPDGTVTQLGTGNGAALGISDEGVIAGYTRRGSILDGTVWGTDGSVTTLTPAPGHTHASVRINAAGDIFGSSGTAGPRWHAATWGTDGSVTLLGDLSEGGKSAARWINAAGVIVGWATRDGDNSFPVRWDVGP